jgi:hypothetical protein
VWVGRVVYPDVKDITLCSDTSFREQANEEVLFALYL